ncbi:hypothetical protein [Ralstonia phage phiITL-1]|uniref:Uncharacterized protein n=1 Tax=Ralstonia phage phiITL-1 TaxID=1597967 RepID=A0A0U1ZAF3_9CAUD|nr:hypothetical protein HOR02_gp10 [Ralstonia phage phiITL-1]AJT60795.1 hypothetical protein [Ralstonia phage phiITL-1]
MNESPRRTAGTGPPRSRPEHAGRSARPGEADPRPVQRHHQVPEGQRRGNRTHVPGPEGSRREGAHQRGPDRGPVHRTPARPR